MPNDKPRTALPPGIPKPLAPIIHGFLVVEGLGSAKTPS